MKSSEITDISKQLFTAIKTTLEEDVTKHPNKIHPYVSVGIYRLRTGFGHTEYSIETHGCEEGFHSKITKMVNNKEHRSSWTYDEITTEVKNTINEKVIKLLENLKTKKGWGSLSWEIEDNTYQGGISYGFIKSVQLTAEPCKEWKALKAYLAKYCNRSVNDNDIWSVRIGGKRGYIYGEEGNRYYLCHQPIRCKEYLEKLRELRGSYDKVYCAFKKYDNIDSLELQSSIRNEVEFGGSRINYLEVIITTPNGKQKGKVEIGKC